MSSTIDASEGRAPSRVSKDWRDGLRRGERDALTRFYEANVDGLYAFVFYRVGRDSGLAEDVVQETFVAALDRLDDYDPGRGSELAWLCTLSRNIARRQLAAAARTEELRMWDRIDDTLAQVFDALDSQPLGDEVLERSETRELVNMAMAHLPERYRGLLEAKYVAGKSLEVLADELALSTEAVKSMLARARQAFKAAFQALLEHGLRSHSGEAVP